MQIILRGLDSKVLGFRNWILILEMGAVKQGPERTKQDLSLAGIVALLSNYKGKDSAAMEHDLLLCPG